MNVKKHDLPVGLPVVVSDTYLGHVEKYVDPEEEIFRIKLNNGNVLFEKLENIKRLDELNVEQNQKTLGKNQKP